VCHVAQDVAEDDHQPEQGRPAHAAEADVIKFSCPK
jgi:hypothetical protein